MPLTLTETLATIGEVNAQLTEYFRAYDKLPVEEASSELYKLVRVVLDEKPNLDDSQFQEEIDRVTGIYAAKEGDNPDVISLKETLVKQFLQQKLEAYNHTKAKLSEWDASQRVFMQQYSGVIQRATLAAEELLIKQPVEKSEGEPLHQGGFDRPDSPNDHLIRTMEKAGVAGQERGSL